MITGDYNLEHLHWGNTQLEWWLTKIKLNTKWNLQSSPKRDVGEQTPQVAETKNKKK